jgi:hypothetical protein
MHKQTERWPMSTSKVSKYNNHNDNIIITITITKSLKPQHYTKHTTRWLQRQAASHNRECHDDSNRYTSCRGKNLTNTPHAQLPEALTYDNHLQSSYSIEIGPLSTGEVFALGLIPPLTTSLRQGVWFGEVVTGLLGLSSPIKSHMSLVHNSRLTTEAKTTRSLIDTDMGYHIETSE